MYLTQAVKDGPLEVDTHLLKPAKDEIYKMGASFVWAVRRFSALSIVTSKAN